MATLDRFIEVMVRTGAERLVLRAEEQAMLDTGTMLRPVTTARTTLPQVMHLLREVAPPDFSEVMSQADSCEFGYTAPAGPVRVLVEQQSGALQVQCVPDPTLGAGAHPPPPATTPTLPRTTTSEPNPPMTTATPRTATAESPAPHAGATPRLEHYFRLMLQEKCSDLHLLSSVPCGSCSLSSGISWRP